MTGRFWLDWAIIATSLFNTILLLWLGLTVLLNANRREWGVWLMGGGLLGGALFFISHSAILGQEMALNLDGLNFWWRVGWFPVTVSPFAWYVAVLWFSGFWATPPSRLRHRHRAWLGLMTLWLVALIALLLTANPIPTYAQLIQLQSDGMLAIRPMPRIFLLFPLWMVTCILLSLDVLPKAVAIDKHVGDAVTHAGTDAMNHATLNANIRLARHRACPWLLGTAGALLAVSLVVAYLIGSMVGTDANADGIHPIRLETVAVYDLVLSLLLALSSLLLGQAIVAYEIFTGRVLPRRSFVRHWRNATILAGGYALTVGWSITVHLRPIYSLLLATLLLTLFYALYSWRSFWEREQFVARLRPFVQGEGTAHTTRDATATATELLAALCREVLGTAHARLIPLGSMAPLITSVLHFPADASPSMQPVPRDLNTGMTRLADARDGAKDEAREDGDATTYRWAISLWDARGRIGALLVGDKLDGGLYSQEEMETAQAAGERIVHLLAGEEMVRRLMELQRKRTAEHRVMDLRTRRTLHDEVLPALHLAILQLGRADRQQPAVAETLQILAETHQQIATLLTDAQPTPARPPDPCELVSALRALVDAEFTHRFEEICWRGPASGQASGDVPPLYVDEVVGEVVIGAAREVIRNAATHGRGNHANRPLRLEISICAPEQAGGEIIVTLADNGVGINANSQHTATPPKAGSGNGLALHSTLLAMVGGYLTIESPQEGGTVVRVAVSAV